MLRHFLLLLHLITTYANKSSSHQMIKKESTTESWDYGFTTSTVWPTQLYTQTTPLFDSEQPNPPALTPPEAKSLFQSCPALEKKVHDVCQRHPNSCRNQCGAMKYGYGACDCHPICRVWNTCCWNFQEECPELAAQTPAMSIAGPTECRHGIEVISRCNADSPTASVHRGMSPIDHREPLVGIEHPQLGWLAFSNRSVLDCYFNQSAAVSHGIVYWRHDIKLEKPATVEDLNAFFTDGQVRKGIVYDQRAPFSEFRDCKFTNKLDCINSGPNNEICSFSKPVILDTFTGVCRSDSEGLTPANQTEKDPPLEINCYVLRMLRREMKRKDRMMANRDDNDLRMLLVASFENISRPTFLLGGTDYYRDINPHLLKFSCEPPTEGTGPCRLRIHCKESFIPVDLVCQKPVQFVVRATGYQNHYNETLHVIVQHSIATVQRKFAQIFEFKRNINKPDEIKDLNKHSTSAVGFRRIKFLQVEYNGTKLPITPTIIYSLKGLLKTQQVRNQKAIIEFCFIVKAAGHQPSQFICDEAWIDQKIIVFQRHFKTEKLQDPLMSPLQRFPANENSTDVDKFVSGQPILQFGVGIKSVATHLEIYNSPYHTARFVIFTQTVLMIVSRKHSSCSF